MRLFNLGVNNRLAITSLVDKDYDDVVSWWLNGRVFGWYISVLFNKPRYRPRLPGWPRRKRGDKQQAGGGEMPTRLNAPDVSADKERAAGKCGHDGSVSPVSPVALPEQEATK